MISAPNLPLQLSGNNERRPKGEWETGRRGESTP